MNHRLFRLCAFFGVLVLTAAPRSWSDELPIRVRFSNEVRNEPFTGRVYLFFSKRHQEPRTGIGWFNPEVFVSRDVEQWQPDDNIAFSTVEPESMLAFPRPLSEFELAGYRVQAVARFNPLARRVGKGPGNGYSQAAEIEADDEALTLTIDRTVPPRRFVETKWTRLLRVRSDLLSDFHGRDVYLEAAVVLPPSYYDEPERNYPTIFVVPGFGGRHYDAIVDEPIEPQNSSGVEFLRVTLDPACPLGHHVFANSANNGPVGDALVQEFLPQFDESFRSVDVPSARFLRGHSSGGWSSLWLQITYPDHFGGTWSTAPDPVDFRDFQRINLYRPGENMYYVCPGSSESTRSAGSVDESRVVTGGSADIDCPDETPQLRPLARHGDDVLLWYRDFAWMEWVLGHGGQLRSFEAVFSPQGPDGKPLLLWDRRTGKIDTEVARSWRKYDINLKLQRNWKTLQPKLAGRLHIFMGGKDTFYLEGATRLLKQTLKRLGSDAVVEIHPGKGHSSLMTRQLRQRIADHMAETFLKCP